MAVIEGPIPPDVVHSTRGVLDYAVWRGIPYVRSWPRKPTLPRSPAVQTAGAEWADFSRRAQATSSVIIQGLNTNRWGRTWTWKDAVTSAAYGRLYGPARILPPTEPASMPANEIKNFPSIERATNTKPDWWSNGANATLTEVTTAAEGIDQTYPRALKVVTTAAAAYGFQPYTYTDEPRLASGQPITAQVAVFTLAGATARVRLQTSAGPLSVSPNSSAPAWTILQVPAAFLNGASLELRFEVDTGTAYFVPLGLSLGTTPLSLPPRGLTFQWADAVNLVNNAGAVDPDAWTDVDVTAQTHPLAAACQLNLILVEPTSTYSYYLRRKGSAQARVQANQIITAAPSQVQVQTQVLIPLSDAQVFQYLLDRSAGASALDVGQIQLMGWWQWA